LWLFLHSNGKITNQAISIVPTTDNYSDIPSVIDYAHKYGIFELIGQLENIGRANSCLKNSCDKCGKCTSLFKQKDVSVEDLQKIKDYLKVTYDTDYEIPICAANIASVHITNRNQVICEEDLLLSCPYYSLEEPRILTLGDASKINHEQICKLIINGRYEKLPKLQALIDSAPDFVFGGCGGNMKQLLKTYNGVMKKGN
jgi:hypothetical protein